MKILLLLAIGQRKILQLFIKTDGFRPAGVFSVRLRFMPAGAQVKSDRTSVNAPCFTYEAGITLFYGQRFQRPQQGRARAVLPGVNAFHLGSMIAKRTETAAGNGRIAPIGDQKSRARLPHIPHIEGSAAVAAGYVMQSDIQLMQQRRRVRVDGVAGDEAEWFRRRRIDGMVCHNLLS